MGLQASNFECLSLGTKRCLNSAQLNGKATMPTSHLSEPARGGSRRGTSSFRRRFINNNASGPAEICAEHSQRLGWLEESLSLSSTSPSCPCSTARNTASCTALGWRHDAPEAVISPFAAQSAPAPCKLIVPLPRLTGPPPLCFLLRQARQESQQLIDGCLEPVRSQNVPPVLERHFDENAATKNGVGSLFAACLFAFPPAADGWNVAVAGCALPSLARSRFLFDPS